MDKTEKQMDKLALKVVELFLKYGEEEVRILKKENKILIGASNEIIDWEILETMKELTDKPKCTWKVCIFEDTLYISLIND